MSERSVKMPNKLSLIVFVILFPIISFATTPAQQIGRLLTNMRSMQANFVQQGEQKSSGKMAIQRPGKFRWQVIKPNRQLIVVNDKKVWIYDVDLQQVTTKHIDYNQTNNPALLLSGSIKELQQFTIKRTNNNTDGQRFILIPKSKQAMFQQIELLFVQGKLQQLNMVDNLGQRSKIIFSDVQINKKLQESLFVFKTPQGVDVVRED